MEKYIYPNDKNISWYGAISREISKTQVIPWRINHEDQNLYHEDLVNKAKDPAGIRISFSTNSNFIKVLFNYISERSPIDLYINNEFHLSLNSENKNELIFKKLGLEEKKIEIWLPQYGHFTFKGLKIDSSSKLSEIPYNHKKKWITYGSSITQCKAADSPSVTWPAIVARTRKYDLTCLGYGGMCHLEPLIASMIREQEADIISLCLGINIYSSVSLNSITFGPGTNGFIKIIREKHPLTPLIVMSPIYSSSWENKPNSVGFTIKTMRSEIEKSIISLKNNGDKNLYYINGLNILNSELSHLLPDDLHPNSTGYKIMAKNILKLLPNI